MKDCSWLDPKKFPEIADIEEFPTEVLCTICHLTKVDRSLLIIELKQFAEQYDSFVKTVDNMNEDEKDIKTITVQSQEKRKRIVLTVR